MSFAADISSIETAMVSAIKSALPTFYVEKNVMATAPINYELVTDRVVLVTCTGTRHVRSTTQRVNIKSNLTSIICNVSLVQKLFKDTDDYISNVLLLEAALNGLNIGSGYVVFFEGDTQITGYVRGGTNAVFLQYTIYIDKIA